MEKLQEESGYSKLVVIIMPLLCKLSGKFIMMPVAEIASTLHYAHNVDVLISV